jgi:methylase of polypeptide subunit release factors
MHYYRHDLALIHDRGQGQHADRCAPGILELLAPLASVKDGLVLELGCGSGALTRHLLAAGFRVIATDASPDMLELARANLGPDADLRRTRPSSPGEYCDGAAPSARGSTQADDLTLVVGLEQV